jgi:murine toxin
MAEPNPPSFIDLVEGALKTMSTDVHTVGQNNLIRLIDTPHVWGQPMTADGVTTTATKSIQDLADSVEQVIASAQYHLDVLSLNPPTGVFEKAVFNGLTKLSAHVQDKPILIRFLFGYVVWYDAVSKFTQQLADFCNKNKLPMKTTTILVGQLTTSLWGQSWNHAKIVAADGATAIVGGHNLWEAAYGQYPPVHDVSVQVIGNAAAHSHQFADYLWRSGGKLLKVKRINEAYGIDQLAPDTNRNEITTARPTAAPQTIPKPGLGWHQGRILCLGRGGVLGNNASDVAKETIIKGARKSLKICQQDLLFLGSKGDSGHKVCHWIAEALLANEKLMVSIIVSPLDAAAGGQQYSWGSGATGTYELLKKLISAKATKASAADGALERLQVAPFCFTEVRFTTEGVDYQWPNPPKSCVIGRFSTIEPTPSIKNYPPAPGNHAKVYIVDDLAYYVGSDNLYPHNLMEYGYLIEGAAVTELLRNYWTQVWGYAAPHIVKNRLISRL